MFTVGRTFEKASFKLGIKDRGSYAHSSTGQTTQSRTLKFARSAAHGDSLTTRPASVASTLPLSANMM